MHDSTLEHRVDNLIAKANSHPASPNPTNGDNNRNYGRPPFQSNSRPKRDYGRDSGCPPVDIQQNLRGHETSAAGPYREANSFRPIQCFRCHGWGHPKRLSIPFKLHLGGVAWDNPSQMTDRRPDSPPPQNPSPQQ